MFTPEEKAVLHRLLAEAMTKQRSMQGKTRPGSKLSSAIYNRLKSMETALAKIQRSTEAVEA